MKRPARAKLSREECLRRMEEFPKRAEAFIAAIRGVQGCRPRAEMDEETRSPGEPMVTTVTKEFDHTIRRSCFAASAGSYHVDFTLRLIPCASEPGVRFVNNLPNCEEAAPFVPFVELGIQDFLLEKAREHTPVSVGRLCVSLIRMNVHPVDSKARRFREAARIAMQEAIEAHGVEVEEM